MRRPYGYKTSLWGFAVCLLLGAAHGQTPSSPGTMWFDVESNVLSFGTLDPHIEPLPRPLVVRVHSDRAWSLKLIPTPGLVVETGHAVPLDRLYWRPNATGLFVPFDTSGPLTLASGAATEAAGELVLAELVLRLEETDPTGRYRFHLRLFLSALDPEETALPAAAFPGETNDETVTVTASNPGFFTCAIDATSFDFGYVDVDGTDFGTPGVVAHGRNGTNTGGAYESVPGTIVWTCSTLPPGTVSIALVSTTSDHTGEMAVNGLEARIQPVTGGTSTGYQPFTSLADLITNTSVGIGVDAARGRLDLRLTVLDGAPPGVNSWIVRLRAIGSP